jgi:hypothetical protein
LRSPGTAYSPRRSQSSTSSQISSSLSMGYLRVERGATSDSQDWRTFSDQFL